MDKLINQFKEGDQIQVPLLVNNVTKGVSNNGAPYLSISFQDRSGSIDGKKWDCSELDIINVEVGQVSMVTADVIEYRNSLQLKIMGIELIDSTKVDFNRFCIPSPIPLEEMERKLKNTLAEITNPDLKAIVNKIVSNHYNEFISYPAATRNHHEYASGLLHHTLSMADLAKVISRLYDNIDLEMLLSGTILHDIGKTIELSGPIATKYTLEGKLIGHISIMVSEIREVSHQLNIHSEVPLLLEHMILSHHGEKDFGSPIPPLTKEAFLLHSIDDLDAKLNIIGKALDTVEEGEFTLRVLAMDNRAFYKPKTK